MAEETVQSIILSELQALTESSRVNGERLARVETSLRAVIGNGAKGRLTLLEEAVQRLDRWRWYVAGGAVGAAGMVSLLLHLGAH
jgi:anti-sigma-K factor RskA